MYVNKNKEVIRDYHFDSGSRGWVNNDGSIPNRDWSVSLPHPKWHNCRNRIKYSLAQIYYGSSSLGIPTRFSVYEANIVNQFGQQRPAFYLPAIGGLHPLIIYQIKVAGRTVAVTEQKVKVGVLTGVVPLAIEIHEKARVEGKVESGSHDIGLELLIIHMDLIGEVSAGTSISPTERDSSTASSESEESIPAPPNPDSDPYRSGPLILTPDSGG